MRLELRVCKYCHEGRHGDKRKTAITRDMVECVEAIREFKHLVMLESLHVTMVEEGEYEPPQALPALGATLTGDGDPQVADTQLVMEDQEGYMLVYPDYADILEVLTGNVEQIDDQREEDVAVDLSPESIELLSS